MMKRAVWPVVTLGILSLGGCAFQSDTSALSGDYMGQSPPGMTAQVFLPGVLNNETTGAFCTVFSPAGDEFYFTQYTRAIEPSGVLAVMRRVNGAWTDPEALPFSYVGADNDLCLSKDGNRMIFRSWRALPDGSKPDNHSWLWYADRAADGWGAARPFLCGGETVRTGYPSIAENGNVYFAHRRDGRLGIYRSVPVGGVYGTPEFVCTVVRDDFILGDMYVALDESYMIISARDPEEKIGYGELDLFITFELPDGGWSECANMGERINTATGGENCPQVTPDGKYFFFNRYEPASETGNMYWIDAAVIEELRQR